MITDTEQAVPPNLNSIVDFIPEILAAKLLITSVSLDVGMPSEVIAPPQQWLLESNY